MKICPNCKKQFEEVNIRYYYFRNKLKKHKDIRKFCSDKCNWEYQKINPYGCAAIKGIFSRGTLASHQATYIHCSFDEKGCLLVDTNKHKSSVDGYPQIYRNRKSWVISRWVFYINNGYLPPVVMHTCDNPLCINPSHLIAGNIKINSLDMVSKGRSPKGLNQFTGGIKLTELQVREIKIKLINKTGSLRSLAKEYDVSKKNILMIKNGERWKHVQIDNKEVIK
jgi:hypothetical protein